MLHRIRIGVQPGTVLITECRTRSLHWKLVSRAVLVGEELIVRRWRAGRCAGFVHRVYCIESQTDRYTYDARRIH